MDEQRKPRRRFDAAQAIEKPKEHAEELTFRMIYAPVLAYILFFRRTAERGLIGAEKFRLELRSQLDRAGQKALVAGYSPEKVKHARFSVVAFIDETVARSNWPDRVEWTDRPLQAGEFDTNAAGDLFFERLEGAEVDEETAEIDHMILSLKFVDRHVGNEREILQVRRRLYKRFPANAVQSVSQLTPEAYDDEIQGLEEESGRWRIWKWLVVAGVALVALGIYVALQMNLGRVVDAYHLAISSSGR